MVTLNNRTALVTGGTHGIGRAIVECILVESARVATIAREVPGELPLEATFLPFDLADASGLPELVKAVENAVGPLDILVNNAGIWRETPALALDPADWRQVIAVNLTTPVLLATAVARGMSERGYGRIVNVTSIHGRFAAESALAYAVAKAGLEQATRNLAVDLASHGILVNAVAPGFISTRLSVMEGVHERDTAWFQRVYVEKTQSCHCAVTPSVAWLASEQNTYITGQVLGVDSGLSITF